MKCRAYMGEKEPLEDISETTGICDPCLEEMKVKIEEGQAAFREKYQVFPARGEGELGAVTPPLSNGKVTARGQTVTARQFSP
jgi:hypothetical protein